MTLLLTIQRGFQYTLSSRSKLSLLQIISTPFLHIVVMFFMWIYVEIEFQEPVPAATCGGRIPYSSKELVNTWPIDGTLTRVLYFMALIKHFNAYIVEGLPFLMQILELLETGDSVKEKVLWYEIKPTKIVVKQEAIS